MITVIWPDGSTEKRHWGQLRGLIKRMPGTQERVRPLCLICEELPNTSSVAEQEKMIQNLKLNNVFIPAIITSQIYEAWRVEKQREQERKAKLVREEKLRQIVEFTSCMKQLENPENKPEVDMFCDIDMTEDQLAELKGLLYCFCNTERQKLKRELNQ